MLQSMMFSSNESIMERRMPGINTNVTEIPWRQEYISPGQVRNEQFPTAEGAGHYGYSMSALTLREQAWQGMMDQITDKPNWHQKVQDCEIQAKWKSEAQEFGETTSFGFSQSMAENMIKVLKQKAEDFHKDQTILAHDPGIIKSDTIISEDLKLRLQAAVKPLENVPESAKDWHPGSNDQVLDLVHPSLFPLIYGRTKILKEGFSLKDDVVATIGDGIQIAECVGAESRSWDYSSVFQWLPCDIAYEGEHKQVKIDSYINNLHPGRYGSLYSIIEEVVEAAIPLWNRTLPSHRIERLIKCTEANYEEWPEIEQREDEPDDDYWERLGQEEAALRLENIIQPEPHGKSIKYEKIDLKKDFPCGLQIIVKLANIHLKPGEDYAGGSWHIEGQANEHIVATALYYYDSQNITESRLAFRCTTDVEDMIEFGYEQEQHEFLPLYFGLEQDQDAIQEIGSVSCIEGRLLTFPNTVQHCVQPFELLDDTKPGHRKILALFLVDPHMQVISTSVVPPQQKDWWVDRLMNMPGNPLAQKLPPEILVEVLSHVEDPMSLDEAKEWRLKLMAERTRFVDAQDHKYHESTYNLCEH